MINIMKIKCKLFSKLMSNNYETNPEIKNFQIPDKPNK